MEVDGRVANDRSGYLLIGSSGARPMWQWSGHGVASTTIHLRRNATRSGSDDDQLLREEIFIRQHLLRT